MRLPVKITSSCIWVFIPVDWTILHWYACGTDGRSCTVTWLPNFLGWVVYYIFSPLVLRCARFARDSSAIILGTEMIIFYLVIYPSFISKLATLGDRSFTYAAPRLCNALPFDVRCAKSVNIFKVKLKTHLFRSALLPPQGFRSEGEIPRRHSSNSLILRNVLTVEIYSQYTRKNHDLLEQGPRGIGR